MFVVMSGTTVLFRGADRELATVRFAHAVVMWSVTGKVGTVGLYRQVRGKLHEIVRVG